MGVDEVGQVGRRLRESLHALVDRVPEGQLSRARNMLEQLL
jgi:hypothetical protein